VRGKDVANGPEEVVAEERVPRPIGQHDDLEIFVNYNFVFVFAAITTHNPSPISEAHLAVLNEGFQNRNDVQRRFICLVDHQNSPIFDRLYKRRILPDDLPVNQVRR